MILDSLLYIGFKSWQVSLIAFSAEYLSDRGAGLERNQNGQVVLLREEHGKGNKTEELEAKIGNDSEKIQIDLSEQEYSETELSLIHI